MAQESQPIVIVDDTGVEHEFPAGFDPKRAAAIVRGGASGVGAVSQGAPAVAPSSMQFLKNAASSTWDVVKGVPKMLGAIGQVSSDFATGKLGAKVGQAFASDPRAAMGRIVSGAKAVGQGLIEPYTSPDAFLKTAYEDPARLVMDASMIGGAVPGVVGKVARAANPVGIVTRPPAAILRTAPKINVAAGRSLIGRGLKPGMAAVKDTMAVKKGLGLRAGEQQLIDTVEKFDLPIGAAGADKGLALIRSKADEVTQAAEAASQPGVGIYGTSKPVETALGTIKSKSSFGRQFNPEQANARINSQVAATRAAHSHPVTRPGRGTTLTGQPTTVQVPAGQARDLFKPDKMLAGRRAEYDLFGKTGTLSDNPNIGREEMLTKGKALSDMLHRKVPSTAQPDADISELIPLVDALQATALTGSRQNPVSLYDMLAMGGIAQGNPGAVIPAIAGLSARRNVTGNLGRWMAKRGRAQQASLSVAPDESALRRALLLGMMTQQGQ